MTFLLGAVPLPTSQTSPLGDHALLLLLLLINQAPQPAEHGGKLTCASSLHCRMHHHEASAAASHQRQAVIASIWCSRRAQGPQVCLVPLAGCRCYNSFSKFCMRRYTTCLRCMLHTLHCQRSEGEVTHGSLAPLLQDSSSSRRRPATDTTPSEQR